MNLDQLTPAPWTWRVHEEDTNHKGPLCGLDGKILLSPTNEGDIAINDADAEFIVLARNALDVMMRRGWAVERWQNNYGNYFWRVSQANFHPSTDFWKYLEKRQWDNPFTAIVEADKWYKENVEEQP